MLGEILNKESKIHYPFYVASGDYVTLKKGVYIFEESHCFADIDELTTFLSHRVPHE